MDEISIADLNVCFKKLRSVSATKNIDYFLPHPSMDGIKIRFTSNIDYCRNKSIWKMDDNVRVVSDYE